VVIDGTVHTEPFWDIFENNLINVPLDTTGKKTFSCTEIFGTEQPTSKTHKRQGWVLNIGVNELDNKGVWLMGNTWDD